MAGESNTDGTPGRVPDIRSSRCPVVVALVVLACSLPAILIAPPVWAQNPAETVDTETGPPDDGGSVPTQNPAETVDTETPDDTLVSVPEVLAVTEGTDAEAVITVTSEAAFGEEVIFKVVYADETATGATTPGDGDYDNRTVDFVRFGAEDTSKDIVVRITHDEVAEEDETFTVTVSPAGPSAVSAMFCQLAGIGCIAEDRDLPDGFALGNATTTVTISDNQPPVLATIDDMEVETGNLVDVTASATDDDGDTITYAWSRKDGETTPALPDDTELDVARLTFTPVEAGTYTMTVTVSDDQGNTAAQTVEITVTAPAQVSVPEMLAVTEGTDAEAVITVTTEAAFGEEVIFKVVYADGTATGARGPADGDYDNRTVDFVRFGAGETTKDIVVRITHDEVAEEDETFTVTVSPAGPSPQTAMFCQMVGIGCIAEDRDLPDGFALGNATTTVTISDNQPPVLTTIDDVVVMEGDEVDITASATDDDGDTITYAWSRKDGETAPALPEGTELGAARLTFTPVEAGTYTMTVTASDGQGNTATQTVKITVTAPAQVSVPEVLAVTEGTDAEAVITVTTEAAFGEEVIFKIIYADGTATGARSPADGDYDNRTVEFVRFGAEETTKDVAVRITHDEVAEEDETFTVTVSPAGPSAVSAMFCQLAGIGCIAEDRDLPDGFALGNATTTVTISDNQPPVLATIDDATVLEGDLVDITAVATDDDGDTITYAWSRKDGETTPALPDDTQLDAARLTFTPVEAGTYTMTVTASDGQGNTAAQTVEITVLKPVAISVPEAVVVTEGTDANAVITVTAEEALDEEIIFKVTYADDTATGAGNPADGDYDNDAVNRVIFRPGDTTKDIVIPITYDSLIELTETFTVTISPAEYQSESPIAALCLSLNLETCPLQDSELPYRFSLDNATTTVTINNKAKLPVELKEAEIPPLRQPQVTNHIVSVPEDVMVNETNGLASFALIPVSVPVAFSETVYFQVSYTDGTATGASSVFDGDYKNNAVTRIAFEPGDTSREIRVPIGGDQLVEGEEAFTVTVSPIVLTPHSEYLCTIFTCPSFCLTFVPSVVSPQDSQTKCTAQEGDLPDGFAMGNASTTVTINDDDTVEVVDPNRAPVLDPITDRSVRPHQRVKIIAKATDSIGDAIAYSWSRKAGETSPPLPNDMNLNTPLLEFRPTQTGTYTMTVTATDSNSNTDSETVVITVLPSLSIGIPETVSVTEGTDSTAVISITAPEAYPATTSFDVIYTDVTATGASNPANGDYDNAPVVNYHGGNFVYLSRGTTSSDITIPITNDDVAESDETFTVTIRPRLQYTFPNGHKSWTPEGWILGNTVTTVTIVDDDDSLQLADLSDVTVKVGQLVDITASATNSGGGTITYSWARATSETTPALPDGTLLNKARLTFTPTTTGTYTMTVTASDDDGNTDTETVAITVAAATVVSVPTKVSVTEGTDASATVTITTGEAFGKAVTFTVAYADGTATGAGNPSNGDYDNNEVTSVAFAAGDTSKTITIPITDDAVDENDETFTVTVSATLPDGWSLTNNSTTVTIADDDDSPELASLNDVAVKVGQLVDVTASATDGDGDTITYSWTRKTGETTPALPNGTLLNKAQLTFTPTTTGTYTMTVTASDGNGNTDTQTVVISIVTETVVSVPTKVSVTEGTDASATVTITTGEAFGKAVTFTVAYADGTATGAGNPSNGDYDNNEVTSVAFAAGDTSKTITIPITDDAVDENDETFTVTVSATLPDGWSLTNNSTTVTIADDDDSPELASLNDVAVKVGQLVDVTASATDGDGDTITYSWTRKTGETTPALPNGTLLNKAQLTFTPTTTGTYTMTVTASDGNGNTDTQTVVITVAAAAVVSVTQTKVSVTEGTDAAVTITTGEAFGKVVIFAVAYADGTATGAGTPADGDYDNNEVILIAFGAADTSKTITIPTTNDKVDENDETFTVTVTANLPNGWNLTNNSTTVTITDDDESPVLAELNNVAVKANQLVDVTASATDGDGDTITYSWTRKTGETTPALPNGTLLNKAQLTFTPTTTGTYTMTVTASDGNGNTDTQTVVITVAAATVVSVPSRVSVTEGSGTSAMVTITTGEAFGKAVTFTVAYADGTATGAGNPSDGDYDNNEVTSVAFAAGDTSKTITIPITDDEMLEHDETFTVTISPTTALPAGWVLGNTTTTVVINNDDRTVLMTVKVGQEVNIIASTAEMASYQWTRKDGETTPSLPEGTVLNQARLKFTPTNVGIYTMTVTTSNLDGSTASEEIVKITVVPATPVVVPATVRVTEGTDDAAMITIEVDDPFHEEVRFNVAYTDDTATGGGDPDEGDYDNDDVIEVVFDPGDASRAIAIPIFDDDTDEGSESFLVRVSPVGELPDGFAMDNASTTVTIVDDDHSPVLKPLADVRVRAGQSVDVTASAADADGDPVTYVWARRDGEVTPPLPEATVLDRPRLRFTPTATGTYTMTVTASDDHGNTDTATVVVAVISTLRFGADDTSVDISIPIPDDDLHEDVERITVVIEPVSTLPDGFVLGNATATVTVLDDDHPPELEPIGDVRVRPGQEVDVTAVATDGDDEDTITYTWARADDETEPALPRGTVLNRARLRFTPVEEGTYTMTVTASDGNENTDSRTVVITVAYDDTPAAASGGTGATTNDDDGGDSGNNDGGTNGDVGDGDDTSGTDDDAGNDAGGDEEHEEEDAPPVLFPINDVTVEVGQRVDVTALAFDPEGGAITYVWARADDETEPALPDDTVLDSARLTFIPTEAGVYTMTVTAGDDAGNSVARTVMVTVVTDTVVSVPDAVTVIEGTDATATVTITVPEPFGETVAFTIRYAYSYDTR